MSPAILALILEYGLRYGPDIANEVITLFDRKDPTADDVRALFAKVRTYDEIKAAAMKRSGQALPG